MPFNIRGVPIVNRYVERDREMSTIEGSLRPGLPNRQRRIVVLHGLGGTGKTQLSLAYARKHRDDHTAIFWLNGQTRDSLKQSIAGVARSLPANSGAVIHSPLTAQFWLAILPVVYDRRGVLVLAFFRDIRAVGFPLLTGRVGVWLSVH